ncbi:MAG: hypothetical protein ACR2HP_08990 [Ilumatobacteraceae bacterium]
MTLLALVVARVQRRVERSTRSTRLLGVGTVAMLLGPCAPTDCEPPPAPPPTQYFGWVGVGGALPSDATCAAGVRGAGEVRPGNATPNATTWGSRSAEFTRATGNFTGSTDEIIQWAACKWGFDENTLRAQVAKESYWNQGNLGDWTTNPNNCAPGHPIGRDGRAGQCPESVGVMQVRTPYFRDSIEGSLRSTAYNIDIALSVWRRCYEGQETWLNDVERGRQYGAGDAWGCIGRWFSGRWYTQPSLDYIAAVRAYLDQRIWLDPGFIAWRP